MMRTSFLVIFITILSQFACGQGQTGGQDWVVLRYIDRYKDVAMEEMIRAGVPASIKLGQAILESNAGRSELARKSNNHFGIKCGSNWTGETHAHEDDDYDENGNLIKSCFRKYDSAKRSFYGHSEFLQKARYRFLFTDLNPQDYESWAHGLKTAGYATNPRYASLLISIIRRYELYQYDKMAIEGVNPNDPQSPVIAVASSGTIARHNDLRMVYASENQTPNQIASQYDVKLKCILRYNEKIGSGGRQLEQGEKVYLQKKRRSWRGREKYHFVQKGETMYQLSQQYGIRLSQLYRKNRMEDGTQPAVGAKVKIRGWRVKKGKSPKLREAEVDENGDEIIEDETDPEEDFLFEDDQVEIYHLVKKGDTLYSLALRYDITVDYLKKLNNLTTNSISVGQRLRVK